MSKRAKIAGAVATLCAVIFLVLGINAGSRYITGREATDKRFTALAEQIKDLTEKGKVQSEYNGHLLECSITFALGNNPPECADIKTLLQLHNIPLTPSQSMSDPGKQPAVAYIICSILQSTGTPVPPNVVCPPTGL